MKTIRLFGLVVLAFFFCLTPLRADIVIMKDGRHFEGKIVAEDKKSLTILVSKGSFNARIPLSKKDIVQIKRQNKTSWDKLKEELKSKKNSLSQGGNAKDWEKFARWCKKKGFYEEAEKAWKKAMKKREKLAEKVNRAKVWYELGKWCREHKLYKSARNYFKRALQIDSDHKPSRKALGYKQYKNQWLTDSEYSEAVERDMRKKGFIKYKGKWYKAEALEALAKMKKADKDQKIKKLKKKYSQLAQETNSLSQKFKELARYTSSLLKKYKSQSQHIEILYRRLIEAEKKIDELEKELERSRYYRHKKGNHHRK